MRRCVLLFVAGIMILASMTLARQSGPYRVLKAAKVGGEGGWDYIYADVIYADVADRRLYIPRRGAPNATPTVQTRLSIYNLDTVELVGEIAGVGGNGAAVDPSSGHGFTSTRSVSMFDTKTGAMAWRWIQRIMFSSPLVPAPAILGSSTIVMIGK